MPEELSQGTSQGAQTATPPPSAPVGNETASSAPPPGSSSGGIGATTSAPSADSQSVRDALANYGLDLRQQFTDDHAALQHVVGLLRQAAAQQQLVGYGQQYLQHASEFQQYLSQRQREAQQAQAQQQQSWWKAPEYDPTWSRRLTRDPQTGEIRPLPGEPPDLVQKYLAWVDHQRTFLDKFAQDPISAIKPGIEQVVQQVAAQMMQQQMAQYQERQAATSFIQQNSSWLHLRDGNGQPIQDPRTGQPMLSDLGRTFAGYVLEAERMGLMDTGSQQRYAMAALQRDFLAQQVAASQQQQAANGDPGGAAKQQFLQQAAANNGQGGGVHVQPPAANTQGQYQAPSGTGARGLAERMMAEFRRNGINPSDVLVDR